MVAPNRHVATFEKLSAEEARSCSSWCRSRSRCCAAGLKPQGFNVGGTSAGSAGAGVAGHVHIHIVPRWLGDVNFMPLLAETKVISEHLSETYDRLSQQFRSPKSE